jgi:hypothetical protein
MSVCSSSDLTDCSRSSRNKFRIGVAGFALAGIFCSGSTAAHPQSGGRIAGPSGGAVAGAAVGVGAAIAIVTVVVINRGHHSLTGCVFNGSNGMKLKTGDAKIYSVEGDTANIKAGDKIKVHGSKVKKAKDVGGDQTFSVDKVSKDYGPCHVDVAAPSSGTP